MSLGASMDREIPRFHDVTIRESRIIEGLIDLHISSPRDAIAFVKQGVQLQKDGAISDPDFLSTVQRMIDRQKKALTHMD